MTFAHKTLLKYEQFVFSGCLMTDLMFRLKMQRYRASLEICYHPRENGEECDFWLMLTFYKDNTDSCGSDRKVDSQINSEFRFKNETWTV